MTNRTRTYECMCLLDNGEVRKGWEPLKEAVAGLFTKHGAKILSNRRWDERRLAYPIEGHNRATYLLVYFAADTQSLPAMRRELDFSESMLRYMIVDCDELPTDAHEPEAEFDVNAIPEDDSPEPHASEGYEGDSDDDNSDDSSDDSDGDSDGDDSSDDSDGDDSNDDDSSNDSDGDDSDGDAKAEKESK